MNNHIRSDYTNLYKLGGVSALGVAALTLGEIIFFIIYPPPETIAGWFDLFQKSPLIGILDYWGWEIPMYLMFIFVFTALFFALRTTDQGLMAISLVCVLVGAAIFFATNNPFSMLTISNQYAAATTAGEKSAFLAAGHTFLANTNQRAVGGFNIGLFLVSVGGLISSLVMRKSPVFPKSIATIGILAFSLSLADYLRQALTQSLLISLLVILLGALFLIIWFILVGLKIYQLGRIQGESQM